MFTVRHSVRLRVLVAMLAMFISTISFSQIPKDEPSPFAPLSSVVSVSNIRGSIPDLVRKRVDEYARGGVPANVVFPLPSKMTDTVRTITGLRTNVVINWLDTLVEGDRSINAPRFGSNNDFVAFFGDGWNSDWENGVVNSSPFNAGSGSAGWLWVNHEYISNGIAQPTAAPSGQHATLANWLARMEVLSNDVSADTWEQADVDTYVRWHKKQLGGSWFRVKRNRLGEWYHDLSEPGIRYDATSDTLLKITGYETQRGGVADDGSALPEGVVPGITGDCSGAQTPWGTIITAEENVQFYYGDFETAWSSSNRFKPGEGFDPGAPITFDAAPTRASAFGITGVDAERKDRDHYGFLTEIDPGQEPSKYYTSINEGGDGLGHRKLGSYGRARWENATFAVGADWKLMDGEPVVMYAGNDRRSGRIYKWATNGVYRQGMTRAEIRALLDEGTLYVAHFIDLDHTTGKTLYDANTPGGIVPTEEAPGQGQWIEMSLSSTDIAPNAPALGAGTTVGQALADVNWNGIGGFTSNNQVLGALFTASTKIGVSEMNRPEDLEYNPVDFSGTPRIYVAFTNHTRPAANNQDGVLDDTTPSRSDRDGSIFAMQEGNPASPGSSMTFTYFRAWNGSLPADTADSGLFDAGDPDNLAIDTNGGVWFGTDGHAGSTGDTRADALYYLDMDPAHKVAPEGGVATYGLPFRIVAGPGDSEATGPWFTPTQSTLFFAVQHPGEDVVRSPSTWPHDRENEVRQNIILFKDK